MTTRFFYLDVVLKRQYYITHCSTRSTMKVIVKSLPFFCIKKRCISNTAVIFMFFCEHSPFAVVSTPKSINAWVAGQAADSLFDKFLVQ